jgi:hypothetical protein
MRIAPERSREAALASWALAALLALCPAAAGADPDRRGEPRLADSIEIVVMPRKVLAVGAGGDGTVEEPLQLNERVKQTHAAGEVAVVVTDRRILAIGIESGRWQETQIRLAEGPEIDVLLGQRITLVSTSQRVLGFGVPNGGRLVAHDVGPNEAVHQRRVGEAVAVVVTSRQALGLSAEAGGFVPRDLRLHEQIESVSTRARSASVRTSQRVLVFDARSLSWSEERIPLY